MKNIYFKIGDIVIAQGDYYQSANGTLLGGNVFKQKGTIKKVAPKGSHPYQIDTVDGWFNIGAIKEYIPPKLKIGDKVTLLKNENYLHKPIRLSSKTTYIIKSIEDDIAIIEFNDFVYKVLSYNLKKV